MSWLAEDDIVKMKMATEMPILDFFIMLDKKIIETKKQIEKARKGQK